MEQKNKKEDRSKCEDRQCPFHGNLSTHGKTFGGYVVKKLPGRIAIEFERIIRVRKYERYAKKKTRIHARLPKCIASEINVGDYVEVKECRPLSKIIHFVLVKKIRGKEEKETEK